MVNLKDIYMKYVFSKNAPGTSKTFVVKTIAIILVSLVFSVHARNDKMRIYLNYAAQKVWTYYLDYESFRTITDKNGTRKHKNTIECTLKGKISPDRNRIGFVAEQVVVESELYDDERKQAIRTALSNSEYGLALINGVPTVDTLGALNTDSVAVWDLYVQFAKLLPDIPESPVRKGYTWERSGVYSIRTGVGIVPCQVYRLYTIKKVSKKEGAVYVTWDFSYQAEQSAMDQESILKFVPIQGKGKGTAIIDLVDGYIQSARVTFETPLSKFADQTVTWTEDMLMEYRYHE